MFVQNMMNSLSWVRVGACRCVLSRAPPAVFRPNYHASTPSNARLGTGIPASATEDVSPSSLSLPMNKIFRVHRTAKLLCTALLDRTFSLERLWSRRVPQTSSTQRQDSQDQGGDGEDVPRRPRPPNLMDFPWVIWPSFLLTARNWFFTHFLIRPHYDPEFSMAAFREGAKQALVSVSEDLATGNLKSLSGRVTQECIAQLSLNFPKLSLKQKSDLKVALSDIFFSFPYQLGIIFQPQGEGQVERMFVEITMCYHIFRGFEDYIRDKEDIRDNSFIHQKPDFYNDSDRISIANYRFIREFTKGTNDDWTINVINHFKPGQAVRTN